MTVKNALKALKKTDTELRVGNYILLFGQRDLEWLRSGRNPDGSRGEYFSPSVQVDSEYTAKGLLPVNFEHGADPDGIGVKGAILGAVDWSTARRDEKGIFVERVLDRRQKYVQFLEDLIDAGLIGTSSEAVSQGIQRKSTGEITRWPLMGDALTVMPCDPHMLTGNQLAAVKALSQEFPAVKSLLDMFSEQPTAQSGGTGPQPTGDAEGGPRSRGITGAGAGRTAGGKSIQIGAKNMNVLEAIKKLIPGLKPDQYEAIATILGLAGMEVPAVPGADPAASIDPGKEPMKSIDLAKIADGLKAMGFKFETPKAEVEKMAKSLAEMGFKVESPMANSHPVYDWSDPDNSKPAKGEDDDPAKKSIDAAYMMRYSGQDQEREARDAILAGVVGRDYKSILQAQMYAFNKYLRGGEANLDANDRKALRMQIFAAKSIMGMALGYDAPAIKATQIEAQGELVGFAVPSIAQEQILTRKPGRTAVRGNGAQIITLARGNSTEIPVYRGNSKYYQGLLRGEWGNETKNPSEKNYKLDNVQAMLHVYTYKVKMSQSTVEDTVNLVEIVTSDIASTREIDQDFTFVTGDGVGKPLGLLPNGANYHGFSEVKSGSNTTILSSGVKAMKRGLPSQYRENGVFVANSDTYGVIEQLTSTDGKFIYEDLTEKETLLNKKTFECGAMPDVAGAAFPMLFCDMSGYTILEKLGMTIQRFQDSGTGPNLVEFHIRDRVGGLPNREYLFAVMKISA
jgi:HK97 family phage major capsid protein